MADFARPQAGDYDPYYQAYLDLVPDNVTNIMNHLKKQGLEVLTLMRTLDDAQGERRYAPDKWSVKEVVGHLIDTERLFAFRTLWIGRDSPAEQPGMDENLWGARSNAHGRRMADLWREQHVCRTDHVYLFKSLDQAAVERRGLCNGAEVTAGALPWLIAGHERHHLNVLKERYGIG